ncbi:MAG: hypothetical protein C4539_18705 [Ignavibacteriales bacterium]|nr:MAG: hypothetical protein C4539_18705 [Ignavibacteriales bacterium]
MIKNYNLKTNMENKIVNSLKNLPRVTAPEDFEIKLKHRLNTLPPPVKSKKFFNFNLNRSLIPAFGLVASLLLVFSLFYFQSITEINEKQNNLPASGDVDKTMVQPEDANVKIEKESKNDFTLEAPDKINEMPVSGASKESKARLKELISSVRGRNVDQSLSARPESSSIYGENPTQPVQFNEYNPFMESDRVVDKPAAQKDTLNKAKAKKK